MRQLFSFNFAQKSKTNSMELIVLEHVRKLTLKRILAEKCWWGANEISRCQSNKLSKTKSVRLYLKR